eukprot:GFYU01004556.1.p1 GENE.GFYU01004556.1~~GFYU01004556.1.p1  ORF type:complete len:264 (-),score=69.05 GFYU01004556.1:469-1260(-)
MNVQAVYHHVIDDVVKNITETFQSEGIDESVLGELRQLWESKLVQSGAINGPSGPPGFRDGDYNEGAYQYDNYAYDNYEQGGYQMQGTSGQSDMGRPQEFMGPPSGFAGGSDNPNVSVNLNIPQNDGHIDDTATQGVCNEADQEVIPELSKKLKYLKIIRAAKENGSVINLDEGDVTITQLDGETGFNSGDETKEEVKDEDDEELGSDLDDGDSEPETDDIVLAQFDKVNRSKTKWKCVLKDGVMHLGGRDYLFVKANGEFEW